MQTHFLGKMDNTMTAVDPNDVMDPTVDLSHFEQGFVELTDETLKLKETSYYVDLNNLNNVYRQVSFIYRCRWAGGGSIVARYMNPNSTLEFVPDMKPAIMLPAPPPPDVIVEPPNKKIKQE